MNNDDEQRMQRAHEHRGLAIRRSARRTRQEDLVVVGSCAHRRVGWMAGAGAAGGGAQIGPAGTSSDASAGRRAATCGTALTAARRRRRAATTTADRASLTAADPASLTAAAGPARATAADPATATGPAANGTELPWAARRRLAVASDDAALGVDGSLSCVHCARVTTQGRPRRPRLGQDGTRPGRPRARPRRA